MYSLKNIFSLNKLILPTSIALSALSLNAVAAPSTEATSPYLIIATGSDPDSEDDSIAVFDSDGGELGANQEVVGNSTNATDGKNGHQYSPNAGSGYHGNNLTNRSVFITPGRWVDVNETGEHPTNGGNGVDIDEFGGNVGTVHKDGQGNITSVSDTDYLNGAKLLLEAPDYNGNVALTSSSGNFVSEGTNYFAELGIKCNRSASSCHSSNDGDNQWKENNSSSFKTLDGNNATETAGVSQFKFDTGTMPSDANDSNYKKYEDPKAILDELNDWKNFINGLDAEYVINSKDIDNYYSGDKGVLTTDLDEIDNHQTDKNFISNSNIGKVPNTPPNLSGKNDGFAVIDVNVGDNDFNITNTDWILQTDKNVVAIFRMVNTGNFIMSNSSIMMGCSHKDITQSCLNETTQDLGAIFFTDGSDGNQAFNVTNTILGGVGLWDISGNNDAEINFNNVQGCTQLVSSQIKLSSTNRLNRCALAGGTTTTTTEVPEPSTLLLFATSLLGLTLIRRRKLNTH